MTTHSQPSFVGALVNNNIGSRYNKFKKYKPILEPHTYIDL